MKFWPEKKRRKILLIFFLILLIVVVPIVIYFEYSVYREVETEIVIKNTSGIKTALLVYHPGLTDFSSNIAYGVSDGLVKNNWRVEISTASSQTPINVSRYDLIVFIWPLYDFSPGPTITNYINRVSDLKDTDTIIVTIGGGIDPLNAADAMHRIVQNANGNIIKSLTIYRGNTHYAESAQQAINDILP